MVGREGELGRMVNSRGGEERVPDVSGAMRKGVPLIVLLASACAGQPGEGPDTAGGTSPTASPLTPSPSPTAPPVAEARLDGEWKVAITVDELTVPFTDREAGDVFRRDWVFSPRCPEGPCDVRVERESPPSSITHELEYRGNTYVDELRFEGTCADAPVNLIADWELEIVDADYIDEVWQATRIEGTVDVAIKPTPEARAADCQAGRERDSFEGRLVSG